MVTCNIALKAWLRLQRVQLTVKIESINNHDDNISENVHKNLLTFCYVSLTFATTRNVLMRCNSEFLICSLRNMLICAIYE